MSPVPCPLLALAAVLGGMRNFKPFIPRPFCAFTLLGLLLAANPGRAATDLVFWNQISGRVVLRFMDGGTRATSALVDLEQFPDPQWRIAGSGDFNGDGASDLLWRHEVSRALSLWLMNGPERLASAPLEVEELPGSNQRVVGVADWNTDGFADILWLDEATRVLTVWLMEGFTQTAVVPILPATVPDANWTIVATGDFDRNGSEDLVWRHGTSFQVVVWFMEGTNHTNGGAVAVPDPPNGVWQIVGAADVDRDGDADLVWRDTTTFQGMVWRMEGTVRVGVEAIDTVTDANWDLVAIEDLRPVGGAAAGAAHALVVAADDRVWSWGDNASGQVGDGTLSDRGAPVLVHGLSDVVQVAAGAAHSLALKRDGSVWGWGANHRGQLGSEVPSTGSAWPVEIVGISGVTAIACGDFHSVARTADGHVWTWGAGESGQLGRGRAADDPVPSDLALSSGLTDVVSLAAGAAHTLVVQRDGSVWAWGDNSAGQLGNGSLISQNEPIEVPGFTAARRVAAGRAHSLALRRDGSVWAWGDNSAGQLGDGSLDPRLIPGAVPSLARVEAVTASGDHSQALKADTTLWSWGDNSAGQLGDGSTISQAMPVRTGTLGGALVAAAGGLHGLAVTADGVVWSWGNGQEGTVGDGTGLPRLSPVAISDPAFAWNSPPDPDAGGAYRWTAGQPIRFDGRASKDPDHDVLRFDWDFGDGTTGGGEVVDHSYPAAGTVTVTLTVTDENGVAVSETAPVTVLAEQPSSRVVWTDKVGVAASHTQLTKTATTAAWDAGAASRQELAAGGAFAELVVSETTTRRIFGLGHGNQDVSPADVEHGFQLTESGLVQITEAGALLPQVWDVATGDRLRVDLGRATVRYLKNGRVLRETALAAPFPLRVDSALWTAGATLAEARLTGVPNEPPIAHTGGPYRWTQGEEIGFDGSASSDDDGDLVEVVWDFGDETLGSSLVLDHVYAEPGVFTVQLHLTDDDGVTTTATTTATVSPPLPRVPAVWANAVGVTVAGDQLTKPGADGWNAGAFSHHRLLSGQGYVETTAGETTSHRLFGLGNADVSQHFNDLEFGLHLAPGGVLRVLESGVLRGEVGTFASGDRLRVAVEDGKVWYLGSGRVLAVSETLPSYPLHLDTSLFSSGATLAGAALSGSSLELWNRAPVISLVGNTCHAPCTGTFTATASDPDGDPITIAWSGCATGQTGSLASCPIATAGSVAATALVRDSLGATAQASATATGTNLPPTVVLSVPENACHPPCGVEVSASGSDPDGDAVILEWGGCAAGQLGAAASCSFTSLSQGGATPVFRPAATMVPTSFTVLNTFGVGCSSAAAVDQQACRKATHRFCLARPGMVGGYGPVELNGDLAYVICVGAGYGTVVTTTFAELMTNHYYLCRSGAVAQSLACAIATDSYCQSQGFATGTGPLEFADGNALLFCTERATTQQILTSYTELRTFHPGCASTTITQPFSTFCRSAIHRFCTTRGFGSGYGPVAATGDAVLAACMPPGTTEVSAVVEVTANDGRGGLASREATVRLANAAPLGLTLTAIPSTCVAPCTVTFNVLAAEPDGDPMVFDWGGCALGASGSSATCTAGSAGTLTAVVSASDGLGGLAQVTRQATITAPAPTVNHAPLAQTGGPYRGVASRPVSFDGRGSSDSDGAIAGYSWSFGDGGAASGPTPLHTYGAAGTFSVTLTVSDNRGATASATSQVVVGTLDDPDADGLTNAQEQAIGSDPQRPDTNGDGLPDGAAVALGLSATDPDMDDDGLTNVAEIAQRTDPFRADSDGDGVGDRLDPFPLDPTRWVATVDPNDHTPPAIVLSRPEAATPVP